MSFLRSKSPRFSSGVTRFTIAVQLSILVMLGCVVTANAQAPPSGYNVPTDRINHTEPTLTGALDLTVSNHKRNYVFTDPIFGSTITRITDETTNPDTGYAGRNYITPSSAETNEWNADSTMFYVEGPGGERIFFSWNGTTHQATRVGSPTATSGGVWTVGLLDGSPCWSFKNPKILYGVYGYTLRSLDFTTVNGSSTTILFTDLVDLRALYHTVTGGTLTGQVGEVGIAGASVSDNIITIPMNGSGQNSWTWVLWYDLTTNTYKILDTTGTGGHVRTYNSTTSSWTTGTFVSGWTIHNVRSALDGRYVSVTSPSNIPGFSVLAQWDTQTGVVTAATTATDVDSTHRVGGFNYWINKNKTGTEGGQWLIRPFSDATATSNLITCLLSDPCSSPQYPAESEDDDHLSWNNARSGTLYPMISAVIRLNAPDGTKPWRPWDNEILAVATDGSGRVWRLGHHHSQNWNCPRPNGDCFADEVFANISQDGKYVLFSSNWGLSLAYNGTARIDAFVLTMPTTTPTSQNVVWTNAVGVSVNGNSLTKTAATGWGNGGAFSTRGIASGDGYAEFTISENNTNRMFGLSTVDANQSYESIPFAIYAQSNGSVSVYESGSYRTTLVTYAAGDRLRVGVESGQVKYYKNGVPLYTSTVAPTYPLFADTAFYDINSTINNAVISGSALTGSTSPANVVWTNLMNAAVSGTTLSKTGGWSGSAVSTQQITSSGGYFEFTVSETDKERWIGLNNGNSTGGEDIDYCLKLTTLGSAAVRENNVYRLEVPVATGDVLRITVSPGTITYSKNGSVFYTSTLPATYPLNVNAWLITAPGVNATITNAVILTIP